MSWGFWESSWKQTSEYVCEEDSMLWYLRVGRFLISPICKGWGLEVNETEKELKLTLVLLSEYKCPVMSCLPLLSPCLPSGTDCTFQLVDQTIPTYLVCVRYFITAPRRVTNTVSILIKCWIFHRHHKKCYFNFAWNEKGPNMVRWLITIFKVSHHQASALC